MCDAPAASEDRSSFNDVVDFPNLRVVSNGPPITARLHPSLREDAREFAEDPACSLHLSSGRKQKKTNRKCCRLTSFINATKFPVEALRRQQPTRMRMP